MNENYKSLEPSSILMHCSLGIGRSAVLLLCDIAFQMAKTEGCVDVYEIAKMIRNQMPNVIASSQEYIMAHLVISECLMAEEEIFQPTAKQPNLLSINKQIEYLNTFSWHDNVAENLTGGRNSTLVPLVEFLDDYDHRIKYYYTKQPQSNNIGCFWTTVLREKIKTIVFINKPQFKPWPFMLQLSGKSVCTVEHISSYISAHCTTSRILLRESDVHSTTLYEAEILFLQCTGYVAEGNQNETKQASAENVIRLIEDERNLDPSPDKLLVSCIDGIRDCGLFIAMSLLIRKYLNEKKYDILRTVRSLRRSNNQFLSKSAKNLCKSLHIFT